MAIIRILKWMSSACDDIAIFLTREIPRLDQCSCHNGTSDPQKVCHHWVCNFSSTVY